MERHNYYDATATPAADIDQARVVTGKLRIEPSLVDLFPALEATLYTAHSAAEAKGITLVANFVPLPEQSSRRLDAFASGRVEPAHERGQVHAEPGEAEM